MIAFGPLTPVGVGPIAVIASVRADAQGFDPGYQGVPGGIHVRSPCPHNKDWGEHKALQRSLWIELCARRP
jgi:hypothetical protein